MNLLWHFRPKRNGDDISDPISGEFFADGSLDNPATALVREALQNALDAGKNIGRGDRPVHVRIGINRGARALPATAAAAWFAALRPHLAAQGSGIKNAPALGEACDYLIIEDFGTSGLTGDIASDDAGGQRNNFVDFLRSDGRTRKTEGDRGSWGVGKNVFPRSSRINCFIAYTIRHDDLNQFVMGKSVLKIRRVGDTQYQPSCYLGDSWEPDQVPRPFRDPSVIEKLRKDFNLNRANESGLSLIVPWPDIEINYPDIQHAVVEQFYFAILAGALAVSLTDGEREEKLDRNTIIEYVRANLPREAAIVELAAWSLQLQEEERYRFNPSPQNKPQRWSEDLIPDDVRIGIVDKLTQRERIAIRIPVHVHQQDHADPELSFFDIYLEHHDEDRTIRPQFFREQLSISQVKRAVGAPKVRALVVINDRPLANLLRAAEPPNHTDWDPKTANFKDAFRNGTQLITFVKSAVKQLMVYIRAGEDQPDPTIAIDFFAMPERDQNPAPSGGIPKKDQPGEETEPFEDFPSALGPARYSISDVDGGFVIRQRKGDLPPPPTLRLAIAYDVFSGNPWKQYEPADFDLTRPERSGIRIAESGAAKHKVIEPNRMQISIDGPEFEVRVTGFDRNRDLIVRAYEPEESVDVDQAAELHEP
ncbi:MAG: hypothetical protein M3Q42_10155 [Pseudomonadota bacterium]|nr:hypothetical protein [Pseudomonadota bacterium]